MWWRPGYGYITRTKSPEAQPPTLPPSLPSFPALFALREPLLPPSPSASPLTRPPRSPARFRGSSIVRKEEEVRRRRNDEVGERVGPTLPRSTANFIPNLRNGRANELLNYSVALRGRGVYTGSKLASTEGWEAGRVTWNSEKRSQEW